MFKITINPTAEAKAYAFDQQMVLIGQLGGNAVDIELPETCFLPEAVQIQRKKVGYALINPSGDPSVTVNERCVTESLLQDGDRIKIGDTELLFEEKRSSDDLTEEMQETGSIEELDELCQDKGLFASAIKKEFTDQEIDKLLQELEEFEKEGLIETAPKKIKEEKTFPSPIQMNPVKEEYQEVEEPVEAPAEAMAYASSPSFSLSSENEPPAKRSNKFLIAIGLIACLFGGAFFLLTRYNHHFEVMAARGVADLSMALTHARLQYLSSEDTPSEQVDMEKHLQAVLAPIYRQLSPVNSEGQLAQLPYTLSFYKTNDLSRFLVFATPKDDLWQKFFAKSSFFLDSSTMEIRHNKNLDAWTPFFQSGESLDTVAPMEIATLVTQAHPLSLSFLDDGYPSNGFAPPKTLAENHRQLIYNAPRYYAFTQPLFEQIKHLAEREDHELEEVVSLLHHVKTFSSLPELVIYSPEGTEGAIRAYQGLKKYAPQQSLLLGSLSFDTHNDKITHADYLSENDLARGALTAGLDSSPPSCLKGKGFLLSSQYLAHWLESPAPPSAEALQESKEDLLRLIDELHNALAEKGRFWKILLEAQRISCEIAEKEWLANIELATSGLKEATFNQSSLQTYLNTQQRRLTGSTDEDLSLQEEQKERLSKIVATAQDIRNQGQQLQETTQSYVNQLAHYLAYLRQAKKEGYAKEQQGSIEQVKKQLEQVKKTSLKAFQRAALLSKVGEKQEMLAQEQLDMQEPWTHEHMISFLQEFAPLKQISLK